MKKLVSMFVIGTMATAGASAATAVPSHISRDSHGGYNVTYDYKDKVKTGWYATARAGVSFLNFTSKQKLNGVNIEEDKFSFEPVFDGSLSVGHHFDYFWRGELELGYMGQFSDSDEGLDFDLSVPYLMANGYYDFTNGLYVGAGLGIALPMAHLDGVFVRGGDRDKTGFSPMAGVMLGWATKLDDNLVLDLRYRLAGFNGVKQDISVVVDDDVLGAQAKVGLIWDNSISVGLRYEF
ncbi:MAG: outer membrane beta-barrel protein [Muribaculaceae bacterium]|nr:outer membrane beta-barrel protein [Muribaculaceae bacterium]